MRDVPVLIVALTVTAYWLRVGAMVVRARRKQHRDVGIVPERRAERMMWLLFVPIVAAWCALPWLAVNREAGALALPLFARDFPYALVRWLGAAVALSCFVLTLRAWRRMAPKLRAWTGSSNVTPIG